MKAILHGCLRGHAEPDKIAAVMSSSPLPPPPPALAPMPSGSSSAGTGSEPPRQAPLLSAAPAQSGLFDELPIPEDQLPQGLRLQTGFLSAAEEADLLELVASLPFRAAQYKQYTARRQVVSYGGSFDYDANRLEPAQPLIEALHPLRDRVAAWGGVAPSALVHALVAEYAPGTPLGWHRDVPDFEAVFGVSLGHEATLRFRPYPPVSPRREDIIRLEVPPRSIYAITGVARWGWQHSVAPLAALRWSITFRTARRGR